MLFPLMIQMIGSIHLGKAITMESEYGEEVFLLNAPLTLGASDCKNNLVGILDALEFLLDHNFNPKRTILAAFGFDEEIRYLRLVYA